MKHLRLIRRGSAAWAHWRSRRLHRIVREEWQRAEECHRCHYLEARVAGLLAELEACGAEERVVVVCRDVPGELTFGRRVGALLDGLLASYRNHPWVWAFIGAVVLGVVGFIAYKTHLVWALIGILVLALFGSVVYEAVVSRKRGQGGTQS